MMGGVWRSWSCGCGCGWLLILVGDGGCRRGSDPGSRSDVLGVGSSHRLRYRRCMGCSLALGVGAKTSFAVLGEALAS